MKKPLILVADGDEPGHSDIRSALSALDFLDFKVINSRQVEGVLRYVQSLRPDLVIVRLSAVLAIAGLETVRQIRSANRRIPIILISAQSTEELAIAALKAGVNDYLKASHSPGELTAAIQKCLNDALISDTPIRSEAVAGIVDGQVMVGESPVMREIKSCISTAASASSNVLITGETGTGKELVAELIHKNSSRRQKAFTCINAAAIPDTLLESELFGYERGSFTGAEFSSEGRLEQTNGGTVFFDEIGDMTLSSQAKILRAIETKRIHRLGGKRSLGLDVRIVAATNQDLEARVAEGKFREDLYFRLNVMRIHLPPLRERKEDIPALLQHVLQEMSALHGKKIEGFVPEVLEYLIRYDWPGNVRELKNVLEAAFFRAASSRISISDFPEHFRRRVERGANSPDCELDRLLVALLSTNWNKSLAAQKLQWSRMTVYRKMAKYQLLTNRHGSQFSKAASHPDLICNKML